MKNIIVSYQKEFGKDGTVYTQTIKTSYETIQEFNKYVEKIKRETAKKFIYSYDNLKILTYLKMLTIGKNYINLTTLDHFMKFYLKEIYEAPKKDKDYERIRNRNTIIKVI